MNARGHNERSFRLDALAADAREGLAKVEQGEEFTIGGWLTYGHALNEGRALFPGDREFGKWKAENVLSQLGSAQPKADDEIAAMWAAANADQFEEARQRGNPRTIRGIHAKWKEIEAERAEEQRRLEAEAKSKADQEKVTASEANENRAESDESTGAVTNQSKPDQETPPNPADGAPTPDAVADGTSSGGALTPAAAPEPPKEKEPKHILKLRREFRRLTPEAQEDEWIGIRLDLNDEKAKRKAAQAEVRKLREINKELSAEDKNAVAVRYESKLANMREQKRIANDNFAAEKNKTYRLNKEVEHLKKKITELERQLENQEFTL